MGGMGTSPECRVRMSYDCHLFGAKTAPMSGGGDVASTQPGNDLRKNDCNDEHDNKLTYFSHSLIVPLRIAQAAGE